MTLHDWLEELERVEKLATPGPWNARNRTDDRAYIETTAKINKNERTILVDNLQLKAVDGELICQSRNAFSKLLTIIRLQDEALGHCEGGDLDSGEGIYKAEIAREARDAVQKVVSG